MSKRLTVYFDEETLRKLDAMVLRSGKSRREVIQEAIAIYYEQMFGSPMEAGANPPTE